MAITLLINSVSFSYPETGDENWGSQATGWAQAVTTGMLQKAGGAFTLTADVNFGSTYGLIAKSFKSINTPLPTGGTVQFAFGDAVIWRSFDNSQDLALKTDSTNHLVFGPAFSPDTLAILPITDADIDAAAAIAFSKMAALTASKAIVTDGSGVITPSATTATQVGYLSTATSDIQTQLNSKVAKAGDTMTGFLTLSANPTSALQAATKQYVDALATGLNAKASVRVATVSAGTLASSFANGQTVDGVTLATNDRVLIKNQAAPADNGIYTVNASGAPTRGTDANSWNSLIGAFVFVTAGTANASTSWVCNIAAGGTLGTTAVTFVQFGAQGTYTATGLGIVLTGSQFSLQLDGTTLSQSGSGVKVNLIANAQIATAAAIAVNKLAALTASIVPVSDGSGFLTSSAVTPTELGYVSGVTSAIQTQITAQIPKSLLTTTNDMIYASGASTPARLAAGADGTFLKSASGVPTWTSLATSYTQIISFAATYAIATTWTNLTMGSISPSVGTPVTLSTDDIIFPYTGIYEVELDLSNVTSMTTRNVFLTIYNTTGSVLVSTGQHTCVTSPNGIGMHFKTAVNITSTTAHYNIQLAASGSGVTVTKAAVINSRTPNLYVLSLRLINI